MSDKTLLPERLVAYLDGDLSAADRADVEAQLAGSPAARQQLASYRSLTAALGARELELESFDLVSAVRRQCAPPASPRSPAPAHAWRLFAYAGALAACTALVVGVTSIVRRDEVRTKGVAAADPQRWAGVRLYRVSGTAAPAPIDAAVARQDGVLVSYTNLGPQPFDYLMVFAVDADQQVRWLYPAWERASEDPTGIAVRKGVAGVELPALIRPGWAVGPLTVHALFTRRPLGVHEVEAQLARGRGALSIAESAEQIFTLTVTP